MILVRFCTQQLFILLLIWLFLSKKPNFSYEYLSKSKNMALFWIKLIYICTFAIYFLIFSSHLLIYKRVNELFSVYKLFSVNILAAIDETSRSPNWSLELNSSINYCLIDSSWIFAPIITILSVSKLNEKILNNFILTYSKSFGYLVLDRSMNIIQHRFSPAIW